MALIAETVFLGADNTISLTLKENGVAIPDHTIITKVDLEFSPPGLLIGGGSPSFVVSSASNPEYFDYTNADRLILLLGGAGAQVLPGQYLVYMRIYTAVFTVGVIWEPYLLLTFK